jgi:histidyl-tRNA synthetase
VKAKNVQMGSIGGGGRYDDLTGLFGVKGIPGVGISFGVDRIYDVMEELKLMPEHLARGTRALFFNMGEAESAAAFRIMQDLRAKNISAELYHEKAKFDKQFKYAERKNISFAVFIGADEIANQNAVVKNLATGLQEKVPFSDLAKYLE